MEIAATYVPAGRRDPAAELRRPPAGATAVEVRADLLPGGTDLAALVAASPLPVLVTLRSRAEGGEGPGDVSERRRFFAEAAALPAALFDLEAERDRETVDKVIPRERVVLSAHFGEGVPADLE